MDVLSRTILDAMSAHIAVLDRAGVILATNRAWQEYARKNGMRFDPSGRRVSYLKVCEGARGPAAEEAAEVADGIRAVIRGDLDEFVRDYPCHSPDTKRWFYVRVARVPGRGLIRAVVSHEDITPLKLAEEILDKRRLELQQKTVELEEANTALRVLLKQREQDRAELERTLFRNVRQLVLPHVERLKTSGLKPQEKAILEDIDRKLNDLASPLLQRLSTAQTLLTPQEIQVAALVREGRSSKEISDLLCVSLATVGFHRKNLRKKLGLGHSPVNLRMHLLSIGE
jgi:DNA-binding CsgD family transcriptional regulator